MSLIRFQLDLAVPEAIYNAIPTATKVAIRDRIRELKAKAVKINAGQDNEEITDRAVWHRCHHDTAEPCEPEVDI